MMIFIVMSCFVFSRKAISPPIRIDGKLWNIMHNGNISQTVFLQDLLSNSQQQSLYALGALSNLEGEILILDNKPFVSFQNGSEIIVENSLNYGATLLVSTSVQRWKKIAIQIHNEEQSRSEMETYISQQAQKLQLSEPFPFLLQGEFPLLDWHVISWDPQDTEHTHQKHMSSGLQGSLQNTPVQILGFYSTKHQGVFTHHTANTHMHVVNDTESIAGHVDNIQSNGNYQLFLPLR